MRRVHPAPLQPHVESLSASKRGGSISAPTPPSGAGDPPWSSPLLGGVSRYHRSALVPRAADALARAETERGRRVLLICDEAHLLVPEQLEDIRMLSLCRAPVPGGHRVDRPAHAARRLRQGAFAAIDQRIGLRVHIKGMEPTETAAYNSTPPRPRRAIRRLVQRRRLRRHPPGVTGPAPRSQQPGAAVPHRHLRRRQGDRRSAAAKMAVVEVAGDWWLPPPTTPR